MECLGRHGEADGQADEKYNHGVIEELGKGAFRVLMCLSDVLEDSVYLHSVSPVTELLCQSCARREPSPPRNYICLPQDIYSTTNLCLSPNT